MDFIVFYYPVRFSLFSDSQHFALFSANSMLQSRSHLSSVLRSSCNRSQSTGLLLTLYNSELSAKSLGVLCSFSGKSLI